MIKIDPDILIKPIKGRRPYSISVEDVFFGDSGKGRVAAELNRLLSQKKKLISVRYNGGANAGHEVYINGAQVVTHQLPMAVVQEGAIALMGRGMVIHPQDLLAEIEEVSSKLGSKLPGKLLIDQYTPLCLDTHRAHEFVLNGASSGGKGSTGRGIAPAYASVYLRIPVLVGDLFKSDWQERLKAHYQLYEKFVRGFGEDFKLEGVPVKRFQPKADRPLDEAHTTKHVVGSEEKFIADLAETRESIRGYLEEDVYGLLLKTWADPKFAFTFEGAQGAGLDPYHGVYPDVTASRPMSRFINDSTYNICQPEEIALRIAVMKTTYMSSVGKRRLPAVKDEALEKWIQEEFDERGRSTGRLRDIYPVSIPIAAYLKAAAGYDYLAATHLDASRGDQIKVITSYKGMPYLPYQEYLDNLEAETKEFKGWDGKEAKEAKKLGDLPKEARDFLEFLSRTIAPVIFATTSPKLGRNYLSQFKI